MTNNVERVSTVFGSIAKKYPSFRDDDAIRAPMSFLDGRRADDNAEGLWRIHDKLYDLSSFAENHPGGKDWISLTKGVDITEYFETHHLYGRAEQLLPKYYIRDAKLPRNYNFIFKPDGFYLTLKKRVMEILPKLDKSPKKISDMYHDITLAALFFFAILTARYSNIYLAVLTGCLVYCQIVIAHNYFHRKDNYRMYGINLSGSDFNSWRITHVLSHHIYTNSYYDVEVTFLEPVLQFLPRSKTAGHKVFALLISPLFWGLSLPLSGVFKAVQVIRGKEPFRLDSLIIFTTPSLMYFFSDTPLATILKLWFVMLFTASFLVGLIALNAGHHHPDVYHEGDELPKGMDFGVYQMNAVIDRHDFLMDKNNHFVNLTTFGHHTLHHLFPTLEHGLLQFLEPTFIKTCKDFEIELREYPWWPLIVGQFKQLLRDKPRSLKEQNRKNI